jgi:hypothetical protein
MRLEHNIIVGINKTPKPMKVIQHRHQTLKKVLTREPMNGRLYHMNYNTSKQQRRLCCNSVGSILRLKESRNG